MHIEKICIDNVLYTDMNMKGKIKNNTQSRCYFQEPNLYHELHLMIGANEKPYKPKGAYIMNEDQFSSVCYWLKNKVKLFYGYASNNGNCFNTSNNTFYNMNTHDCHVSVQKLLLVLLCGHINDCIWAVISKFSKCFMLICSNDIQLKEAEKLEDLSFVLLWLHGTCSYEITLAFSNLWLRLLLVDVSFWNDDEEVQWEMF